ncbi:MAG: hypothetical protein J0M04_08910 [Verrucomicrobia bacterium]|nr:hypothetical protein [Verrucomicrobiota bacterium]
MKSPTLAIVGILLIQSVSAKVTPRLWDCVSLGEVCSAYGLGQVPAFPRKELRETDYNDTSGEWKLKSIRKEYALHGGLLIFTTEIVERRGYEPTKELVAECSVDLRFAAEHGAARRALDTGPVMQFLKDHGISVGFGPKVSVKWRQFTKDSRQEIFVIPGSAYITVEPSTKVRAFRVNIRPLFIHGPSKKIPRQAEVMPPNGP